MLLRVEGQARANCARQTRFAWPSQTPCGRVALPPGTPIGCLADHPAKKSPAFACRSAHEPGSLDPKQRPAMQSIATGSAKLLRQTVSDRAPFSAHSRLEETGRPTPPPAENRCRAARENWHLLRQARWHQPKNCSAAILLRPTLYSDRAPWPRSHHGGPSPPPATGPQHSLRSFAPAQATDRNLRFATTAIEDRAGQPPPREGRTASFTASLYPSNYSRAPKPRNRAPLQTAPIGRASRRHPTRRELLGRARSSFRCRRLTLCENHLEPPCSDPTVIDRAPGRFILFCN